MDYYRLSGVNWSGELEDTMMTIPKHTSHPLAILIIGLGQTGLSCARFCSRAGHHVAMMDTRDAPPALDIVQRELPNVVIHTGSLDQQLLQNADTVILSPGIDPRLPEIVAAREAGIEVIGDIEWFARHVNAPVVAITGSNGKSTVTSLLAAMAIQSGKQVQAGGNLGTPALDLLTEPAPDFYILELSSFQLETIESLNAYASTVLNISPDHMDRYDSFDAYQHAKATIFAGDGVMVLNRDDAAVMRYAQPGRAQISFSINQGDEADFGVIQHKGQAWLAAGEQPLIAVDELKITGRHNYANALAALALGSAMGLEMSAMLMALRDFEGLPHRCRYVCDKAGVRWINDSKATNVGACIAAIEGLADAGEIILIAGGVGKAQDFSPLTAVIDKYVRDVILLGQDAGEIERILPRHVGVSKVATLRDAVIEAKCKAHAGDQVLLSPACASFDMFSSYEQRGEAFEQLVREYV